MPPIPLSSLSEADQTRLKTRNSYRRALQTILDTICNAQTENLDPSVCEQAGIHRQPLSLDEDSQWAPLFFHRYQEALGDLSEPDETPIEYDPKHEDHDNVRSLHHFMDDYINDHHPKGVPGSWVSSWDAIKCGALFESAEFNWTVSFVALTVTNPDLWQWRRPNYGPNPPQPHVRCIMQSWVIGDDRLLRGEIQAIIKIMRARLHVKGTRQHLTAPILLFSTMGPWQLRVLEAYFNGTKLVVRNTPLYDMRGKDEAVLQNLTRWWYGHGIGNTEVLHLDNDAV